MNRSPNYKPIKVIKTSLKSIASTPDTIIAINDYCSNLNLIVIHAYQFLRLFILHSYHSDKHLPIIDIKLVTNIIKTVSHCGQNRKPVDKLLHEFYLEHYQQTIQGSKLSYAYYSNTLNYTALTMLTCFENNIKQHFIKHLRRVINAYFEPDNWSSLSKDEKHAIRKRTKFILDDLINNTNTCPDSSLIELRNRLRENLIPRHINKNVPYDLECSPQNYVYPLIKMSLLLEESGRKLFQFCPLRTSLIPKYMTLDTVSLIKMLVNCDEIEISQLDLSRNVNKYKEIIWASLFNMKKISKFINPNKYVFHHMLSTDGIGCSLTFIRSDLKDKTKLQLKSILKQHGEDLQKEDEFRFITELSDEELDDLKDQKKVAIDPGKNCLMFMVDEEGNKLKYTKMQRRSETYAKRKRIITMKMSEENDVQKVEQQLSQVCSKTCDYEKFIEYLTVKNEVNEELKEYYKKEILRKLRWRSYTYTQKSQSKLINRMKEKFGEELIIGFGSWNQSQQMKGSIPTPCKGLKRMLEKHFKVLIVDEYKTSKMCSFCLEGETSYCIKRENPKPYREGIIDVHGLLTCKKCSESGKKDRVNRDLNGSRNILYIMKEWIEKRERPEIFKRSRISP
jgi:hypothetical protein